MRISLSLLNFILIICIFLLTACSGEPKPYTTVHGLIITDIDTSNSKVRIGGVAPSSLVMIKDYEYRIAENAMYIKVMLTSHKYGKYKIMDFEQELSEKVEKIFIEDEKKRQVMIWEKSQGYGKFDMQVKWEDELQKLKE